MSKMWERAFKRLPERYRKRNNSKLYYVLYGGYDELKAAFSSVEASRNIDFAFGKSLDLIGENVGQLRKGEDDELYRKLIKVRIIANMSIGDIPTINKVMSTIQGDGYRGLKEVYLIDDMGNEPAAIRLDVDHLTSDTVYELVERIKAGGVRIIFGHRSLQDIYIGIHRRQIKYIKLYSHIIGDIIAKEQNYIGIGYARKLVRLKIYEEGYMPEKKVKKSKLFVSENGERKVVLTEEGAVVDYERG